MFDVINKAIIDAKKGGRLNRIDVVVRYLRIKYNIKIASHLLEKRIKLFKSKTEYSV